VTATIKTSWLDRAAMTVSPRWGIGRLQHKARYSAALADGFVVPGSARKSMKGVTARANSPDDDQILKLSGMRALSRDLSMNSPLAISILRRHQAINVGSGLQLQSVIDREVLGLEQEEAEKYERQFEREFDLWAESKSSDFAGICSFGGNQALGYLNMLTSGDFFFMPVWRPPLEKDFPYELAIKMIDADLVRNPSEFGDDPQGRDIQGGVEMRGGVVVAYHVWNTYPNADLYGSKTTPKCTRIPVYDASGRQQIYHVFNPERISQRRGIPLLAGVADSLKQLTRLSDAQLMSALVSSYFTVFVKDASGQGSVFSPALTPDETITGGGRYGPNESEATAQYQYDANDLEMGVGNITYLDEQKDVVIADPGKTDKHFEKFWEALATQSSAAGNMPIEQAQLHYTTSYTAARAAANDAWKGVKIERDRVASEMCRPVYRELQIEGILRGRLQAPGYFDDYATQRAWRRSLWVGSGKGTLDPYREAKASALELSSFTTTHEQEYVSKHGGRWDAAMDKRAREEAKLVSLGLEGPDDENEQAGMLESQDIEQGVTN
jgi:lambda family phage portal protein